MLLFFVLINYATCLKHIICTFGVFPLLIWMNFCFLQAYSNDKRLTLALDLIKDDANMNKMKVVSAVDKYYEENKFEIEKKKVRKNIRL